MPTEIAEIKEILRELLLSQKETAASFKETDARFKETDAKFKETAARFKETDAKFKETDVKFKETDEQIKKAFQLFETQWGKLIESLVAGDLIRILRDRNIEVTDTSTRRKGNRNNKNYEFDIIAHNGNEIVIVEVKTTLRAQHVKKFVKQLEEIKSLLPEYKEYKVYGAVAFLDEADHSAAYAENKKLFVIKATGDSASITNAEDFVPRVF